MEIIWVSAMDKSSLFIMQGSHLIGHYPLSGAFRLPGPASRSSLPVTLFFLLFFSLKITPLSIS